MPKTILKLSRKEAVNAWNLIRFLGGDIGYKNQRTEFQAALMKAWPEMERTGTATPIDEKRPVEFTSEQQRAMAEGVFAFCSDAKTTGEDFTNAMAVGQSCRLSGWLSKHITAIPSPKFEGELDGEPDLLDEAHEEAAQAPKADPPPVSPPEPVTAQEAAPEARGHHFPSEEARARADR